MSTPEEEDAVSGTNLHIKKKKSER